jgi:endonuclease YncB( thermonuclease family)
VRVGRTRAGSRTWWRVTLGVVAALVVVGLARPGSEATEGRKDRSDPPTTADARPPSEGTPSTSTTSSTTSTSTPAPVPDPGGPGPDAVSVTEVTDGDTIVVSGGVRVRLIGIDTPERGQCGFHEASDALEALIGGRRVVLAAGARDDSDRYGRLLRYVEADGTDLNLEMVRRGHAIARYDSRDGYGGHPREGAYVAADAASAPAAGCGGGAPPTTARPASPPAAPVGGGPSGGAGLDVRHGSCRLAIAAGLGPYVRGRDPEYDWYHDGDSDGIVCER